VLLRWSCDGVAAATELRSTSFVALILRVASRRDALNEEPASYPPGVKARVRGAGLAMCKVAFSGCGAGAPQIFFGATTLSHFLSLC